MSWKRIHAVDEVWIVLDAANRNIATVSGEENSTLILAAPDLRDAVEKSVGMLKRNEIDGVIELLTSVAFRSRRG